MIAADPAQAERPSQQELTNELRNDATQIVTSALINAYDVRTDQALVDQALGRTTTQ
ncbi:hypothetical protein ABWI01_01025 [Oceanicaulis alexandrii]|uniref:hypothetical protein n=1 Tax=Oceanicaulis alexandrii TaxID=153233 RepID=UPI0035CF3D21